jgi:hypothetical protein
MVGCSQVGRLCTCCVTHATAEISRARHWPRRRRVGAGGELQIDREAKRLPKEIISARIGRDNVTLCIVSSVHASAVCDTRYLQDVTKTATMPPPWHAAHKAELERRDRAQQERQQARQAQQQAQQAQQQAQQAQQQAQQAQQAPPRVSMDV